MMIFFAKLYESFAELCDILL